MADFDPQWLNRRSLLAGSGLALFPVLAPSLGAAAPSIDLLSDAPNLKDPWMEDPQKLFENFLRSQGDLTGRISPQWWRGAYLAIFADRQPELMFRMEGCEMKRVVELGDGDFEFQYRIFTCFQHPDTGEMLNGQPWRNPVTGEEVIVQPNISSALRIVRLTDRGIVEITPESGFEALIHMQWTARGPYMMYNGHKDRPVDRPIPIKEFATSFHDRAAAADFSAPRLEMQFNSTFVAPFQPWMKMPPNAGIAVWHASGHKAADVQSLPAAYLEQLAKYRPELAEWIGDEIGATGKVL